MKSLHGQSNVDPSPFNLSSQLIVKIKKPRELSAVQISITTEAVGLVTNVKNFSQSIKRVNRDKWPARSVIITF